MFLKIEARGSLSYKNISYKKKKRVQEGNERLREKYQQLENSSYY